ncbi:transcription factor BIM3-like isoform X2 [Phragmites australis]|uniref:transcription factor BIM3-like isoform X2 n=1 Tax=Phragmites australis TaxID=29695 RepID=UPI002D776A6A|nr:transcription factor BIM3-like isoform X2 [Phragmites australis]
MGLQGDKATHDFLSLYTATKDSALPLLQESKKPPPPSQGFFLKTHDFLQPLARPSQSPPLASENKQQLHGHTLPGGVGAFSITDAAAAAVKEEPPFALWAQPDPRDFGNLQSFVLKQKQKRRAEGVCCAVCLFVDLTGHPWSLPFAARCVAVASARPQPQQQQQQPPERKRGGGFMDAGSRSSGGTGFDDDDGLAARREVSSSLKELTVRVETKGGSCSGSAGTDQLPNTPRSKHSATEQRRRSKINDRFQILREILPQNDQKRDKASFLLEVIEYIRFLQEKVQKHEVSHQEWNQENAKIMPWSNIYFRSSWKNAQNKDEINGDTTSHASKDIKNGSSPGFSFAGKPEDYNNAAAFDTASDAQELSETNAKGCVPYKEAETPSNVANNVVSQQPGQLTKTLPTEYCAVNSEMLTNPELAIEEGTISLSSQYSKGLLSTLNDALQTSGIDLSQASISVQINLGKRAIKRSAPGANSTSKESTSQAYHDQAIWQQLKSGDGAREHSQATKRHKSDR